MIILDTYTWVWWVHGDKQATETQHATMLANEVDVIGVSAISCWEVAKFEQALNYPGFKYFRSLQRLHLNLRNFPGEFYHDPDDKILNYAHVKTIH